MSSAEESEVPALVRLDALLREPSLVDAPGVHATLDAWVAGSVYEPVRDTDGWPVYLYNDPRTGLDVAWSPTGIRPNGLVGWFEVWDGQGRRGSWRIDLNGRVHRGTAWLAARGQPRRTLADLLRVLVTEASEADRARATREAQQLLGVRPG